MKAHFRSNGASECQIIEFEPENETDSARLREFGTMVNTSQQFRLCGRGFGYMEPLVSVYIQPLGGVD